MCVCIIYVTWTAWYACKSPKVQIMHPKKSATNIDSTCYILYVIKSLRECLTAI